MMSAPADEDQRALPNGMIATAELEDLAGPLSKALAHIIKALTQLDSATAAESNVYTGTTGVALFFLRLACLQHVQGNSAAADTALAAALGRRHTPARRDFPDWRLGGGGSSCRGCRRSGAALGGCLVRGSTLGRHGA